MIARSTPHTLVRCLIAASFVAACNEDRDGVEAPADTGAASFDVDRVDGGPARDAEDSTYDGQELFEASLTGLRRSACRCGGVTTQVECFAGDPEVTPSPIVEGIDLDCVRAQSWSLSQQQSALLACWDADLAGDLSTDTIGWCGTGEARRFGAGECDACFDYYLGLAADTCGAFRDAGLLDVFADCAAR